MRPWARGRLSYESMTSGSVTMMDIARMNDALDVFDENARRAAAAREKDR